MIKLENIYKFYYRNQVHNVVLDHVNAHFQAGRSYAILGMNGTGKSTLVRLLSGAELPNGGRITRSVRISWPLGFSGGLHGSLTGRENVRFVARAYGEDAYRVLAFVEDFAEVGEHIDMPVSTYSSGMRARVAFGLSLAIDFDCYLIDETLSVGDARFRERCRVEFARRREHSDIIMVTHSMGKVKDYCQSGLVLANRKLYSFENIDDAIELYTRLNLQPNFNE
jgi:capsular polysaccharide transport system ATP-binding protein